MGTTDARRNASGMPGPEVSSARHAHPGDEIIYVLEGSLEYQIEGRPPKTYHEGEALG